MTSRALSLAIHLLTASALSVTFVSSTGCLFGCGDTWRASEDLDLGVTSDLHAVADLEFVDTERRVSHVAVGAEGVVVAWGYDSELGDTFTESSVVGEDDLRALWLRAGNWWVVGDGGVAAVSGDGGLTWTTVDLGTSANLHAITNIGSQLIIAGDEIVLVQDANGEWAQIEAPAGGWGQLRGLYYDGQRIYAVGLAGVIRSASDPEGAWEVEDADTDVDLFAVNHFYFGNDQTVVAVGAGGSVVVRKSGGWDRISNGETVDLVDYSGGYLALGADGELFEISSRGKLSTLDTFEGARGVSRSESGGVVAVGDAGIAYDKGRNDCIGGRPFLADGTAQTASLCHDDAWCSTSGQPRECAADPELPAALAQSLAAAWAQDGLYEHASVASFARAALELLALGAPPRLLRELSTAIDDELRHAEACFALARRFGGQALSPGPMPIPANALERSGDPVATALAVFEEGCINESVAACEAADAAGRCEDPEVRAVLEGIATDERRHAVMAWSALRWLLDVYGEQVAQPLRARLGQLRSVTLAPNDASFDPASLAFGRLSPRHRSHVYNEVLDNMVRPLASAMFSPESPARVERSEVQR